MKTISFGFHRQPNEGSSPMKPAKSAFLRALATQPAEYQFCCLGRGPGYPPTGLSQVVYLQNGFARSLDVNAVYSSHIHATPCVLKDRCQQYSDGSYAPASHIFQTFKSCHICGLSLLQDRNLVKRRTYSDSLLSHMRITGPSFPVCGKEQPSRMS